MDGANAAGDEPVNAPGARPRDRDGSGADEDPGAFIGHEPEREAESIPGGVQPADERIAAIASRPGVDEEPDATDAVEGPIGGAHLVEPSKLEDRASR